MDRWGVDSQNILMNDPRMTKYGVLQRTLKYRLGLPGLALLVGVALLLGAFAESAAAARIVGKDGKVYACYRTKGKAKGGVRLVAKRQHCRRGERKVSWNATGPAGEAGRTGSSGESGGSGESGARGEAGLETRVTDLTTRLETLEGKLKGITNTDLTGALAKLQGVTGTQLQEAVTSVADVNALCAQATTLTTQVNALGTALTGASLSGLIPAGLTLLVPGVPSSLPAFGCPP